MSASTQSLAILQCHPDTSSTAVDSIEAVVRRGRRILTITYTLNGVADLLQIPLDQSPRKADDLWQHTCFEAFIGAENDTEYYEFNFSPSGEWAAYVFRDYRDGGAIHADGLEPKIAVQRNAGTLDLSAALRLDRLPGIQPDLCLWLGLSAVIEDLNGSLCYWALKHPPGKPDFHHSDNFTLQIKPVVVDGRAIDYTSKP